jgi:hypothetical protein
MSSAAKRLAILLDSVEIVSPSAFRMGGEQVFETDKLSSMSFPQSEGSPPEPGMRQLRDAVASMVYVAAYARVYQGGPVAVEGFPAAPVADPAFVGALSAANRGATRWDAGWKVYQAEANGAVHVRKGETATLAQAGQYATGGFGLGAGVGSYVQLLVSHESTAAQPGWYHALGETVMGDHDTARIGRLYFHVPAGEAPWLVGALTGALNRYRVPFRLKTPVDPAHLDRTDGLVLYVPRRFVAVAMRLVLALSPELKKKLTPGTPLFARELRPGLSAADDPGTGESFGQSRCRLVADAILEGGAGPPDPAARTEALRRRFRREGLDAERPHLAAGLAERYVPQAASAL